jgi:hypothetical protein
MSQKIELFITTTARTLYPIFYKFVVPVCIVALTLFLSSEGF